MAKKSNALITNNTKKDEGSSPEMNKKRLKKLEQKLNKPPKLEERPISNTKFTLLSIFCAFLAIVYLYLLKYPINHSNNNNNNNNQNNNNFINKEILVDDSAETIKNIETGLKKISGFNEWDGNCHNKTVAVGYNTNLDLVVDAIELLEKLKLKPQPLHHQPKEVISSLSDFEAIFSYYFKSGSAAERYIQDEETFESILAAALASSSKQFYTGGNAGIMANRLVNDNCNVYLGGIIGKKLKQLISPKVNIIGYESEKGEEFDEVHLILEYGKKSVWGEHRAPRANRFIISRDNTNSNLLTMESFHSIIEKKPDLILLSGLHLLTDEAQERRVEDMVKLLADIPYNSDPIHFLNPSLNMPIHLELASIASSKYISLLVNKIVPFVDSIGLNEQELGFIYVSTGGKKFTLDDFKEPTVNTAVEAIIHIFDISFSNQDKTDSDILGDFGIPTMSKQRSLTRIHFHYLSFHIVSTKAYSQWSPNQSSAAVAASSIEATNQACLFNDVELHLPPSVEVDYRYTPGATKTILFNKKSPVTYWQDSGYEFHVAPVLVCKSPMKTVGLGDSISTMGFLYQTIKSDATYNNQ
ncbi:hypothetical protein DICPUDRAFT_50094 [Dictyostelium purpureum]|uniref:ADP-dependent glucokinase n=1 Tax=Dictyostelium purpureum TaxID=5786 RepID=F0ZWQ9_DICPU|nr:uncharacterized protein DICPUDRAFT_50094 [Dictyostelium purpureum]EGC31620.1 hypothetical protein DICPUDRAFT_50094 [Dictyostelium purpureum]|eukprot:XP_003291848.1 hypothetical protein DICPUDRAFT_50094 [Dictyostelium purpureum]